MKVCRHCSSYQRHCVPANQLLPHGRHSEHSNWPPCSVHFCQASKLCFDCCAKALSQDCSSAPKTPAYHRCHFSACGELVSSNMFMLSHAEGKRHWCQAQLSGISQNSLQKYTVLPVLKPPSLINLAQGVTCTRRLWLQSRWSHAWE